MRLFFKCDVRLDKKIKDKVEKAMILLGYKNLTDYVVNVLDENASQVIAGNENITLTDSAFDLLWAACNKPNKPNKALKKAAKYAKEQGFK